MRARLLTSAVIVTAMAAVASPAAASDREESGAYVDDEKTPVVIVGESTDPGPSGGGGSSGGDSCVWVVVVDDDLVFNVYGTEGGAPQYSATGRWLQKLCDGNPVLVAGSFLVPEGGLVDPEALAQEALASIALGPPVIRTSPDADGRLYVRVPTWLWLDETWWRPYEATAATGRVTATVTARPVTTTWDMGDGTTVECAGPGTAWIPGLADDATACSHTYTTSSAGRDDDTFALSATTTFEVTWTSNISAGGTLSTISRTSSRSVEVGEIQAIGTR